MPVRGVVRWWSVALVALALIATACGDGSAGDVDRAAVDEVVDAAIAEAPATDEGADGDQEEGQEEAGRADEVGAGADGDQEEGGGADELDDADEPDEGAGGDQESSADEAGPAFDAAAEPLVAQFSPIEPGTYRVDTLGTPFSLTFAGEWWVQPNGNAFIALTHPNSRGPGDRDIAFLRPSHLADPGQPWAPSGDQEGQPVAEFSIEQWLDAIADGIVVGEPEATTIGGADAVTFEVEVERSTCGPEFCVGFATNRLISSLAFEPNIRYRVWWVDQGVEAPIVAVAAPKDEEFGASVDALLATLAFGPAEPDPIVIEDGQPLWEAGYDSDVPAGTQRFPAFGGLEMELDTDRFVVSAAPNWLIVTDGPVPADLEIWAARATADGTPIGNADELVAALEALDVAVTPIGELELPLGPARVVELERASNGEPAPDQSIVTGEAADGSRWRPPKAARAWIIETERGVIVATAEVFFADALDLLPRLIEVGEAIVPTLRFTDGVGGPVIGS